MLRSGLSHTLLGAILFVFTDEIKVASRLLTGKFIDFLIVYFPSFIQFKSDELLVATLVLLLACFGWGVLHHATYFKK